MNVSDMTDEEIRNLDPETVHSRDDCLLIMDRIDLIKAAISAQLNAAQAKWESDWTRSDAKWLYSAKSALKFFKVQRAAFQARDAILAQRQKEENMRQAVVHRDIDNYRFVTAARDMLPKETYLSIWDAVNRMST